MLSFAYTEDLQLSTTLASIDRLRSTVLTLPISMKSEVKLQWESMAARIWATLALADYDVPKQHIATILAHPTKPTEAVRLIFGQRGVYDFIHTNWRASPKPVTVSTLETIFTMLYPKKRQQFVKLETSMKELVDYLSSEKEHPIIQAAIAHIHILTQAELVDAGLLARAVHYLYLAKYGYDLRGYVYPEKIWLSDSLTYTHIAETYARDYSLNSWLSYMAETTLTNLQSIATDIQESRFHIEFPPSFWELNDRQKEVLALMDSPDATITTKKVQKRFKTSQITASRDLTRLASLGLLYPHGKGRSIYYTKI